MTDIIFHYSPIKITVSWAITAMNCGKIPFLLRDSENLQGHVEGDLNESARCNVAGAEVRGGGSQGTSRRQGRERNGGGIHPIK